MVIATGSSVNGVFEPQISGDILGGVKDSIK